MRIAVAGSVHNQADLDLRALAQRLEGDRTLGLRDDQHPGFAVVDDVGEFIGGQERIDAGEIESGALARAAALDVARVVLHEDRVVIETFQAAVAQEMRQAVGACFEFRIGDRFAGLRHDEGRLAGSGLGVRAWIHWPLLPVVMAVPN